VDIQPLLDFFAVHLQPPARAQTLFTSPFFRRLFFPHLILLWLAIALVGFLGAVSLRTSYIENTKQSLYNQCRLVSDLAAPLIKTNDLSALNEMAKHLGETAGCRITIIQSDGRVIADNEADPRTMDNHRLRPEIVGAATQGDGDSLRHSDTVHTGLLYFAHRIQIDNGPYYYVRLSEHLSRLDQSLRLLYAGLLLTALLAMLGSGAVSYYLAHRHAAPVVQLNEFANALARGDLKSRILRPQKDEMGSLAMSLNAMADSLSNLLSQTAKDKAELSAILESMSEGVIAANLRQQILLVNDAAGRLFGFPPAEAQGKNLWEVLRDQQVLKAVKEIETDGGRTTVTVGPVAGRKLEVTVSVFPATGPAEGLVIVSYDVTESSRYQELRKEFVANVSHELRTPLTVIRGFVETLQDGAISDPIKGPLFLSTIQKHTEQLSNLVSDLLEISQLESQPSLPRAQSVDIGAVIRRAADLLSPAAAKKNHQFTINTANHLPSIVGNGDYLDRAVSNLMENAIKYTRDNGRVHVVAKRENGHVIIDVTDNGIGIPPEDLARIFERFYRVDRSRSREMGGTGLGLSIVKHVAQVHGGSIEVISTPGQGSTFRLKLPVAPNEPNRPTKII
jgi:two-component system phosphate regulon sensor histidine kinase PhoR